MWRFTPRLPLQHLRFELLVSAAKPATIRTPKQKTKDRSDGFCVSTSQPLLGCSMRCSVPGTDTYSVSQGPLKGRPLQPNLRRDFIAGYWVGRGRLGAPTREKRPAGLRPMLGLL